MKSIEISTLINPSLVLPKGVVRSLRNLPETCIGPGILTPHRSFEKSTPVKFDLGLNPGPDIARVVEP